jgi:hypothetical protein
VSANSSDAQSAVRLKAAEFVLQMDPSRRQSSVAQRKTKLMASILTKGTSASPAY